MCEHKIAPCPIYDAVYDESDDDINSLLLNNDKNYECFYHNLDECQFLYYTKKLLSENKIDKNIFIKIFNLVTNGETIFYSKHIENINYLSENYDNLMEILKENKIILPNDILQKLIDILNIYEKERWGKIYFEKLPHLTEEQLNYFIDKTNNVIINICEMKKSI